jgi:pheromone shutdown protein TraB
VSQATIDYRNQYILEMLPVLCETYDTIFIVMGCDHAEALKADLEAMMENA